MYLSEVRAAYEQGQYKPKMEYPTERKLLDNHIFDEDQTVKWNREQVQIHNAALQDTKKEYRRQENEMASKLRDDAITALETEFDVNRGIAEKVWDYTYREYHAHMSDVWGNALELAELVIECIKIEVE